MEKTKQPIFKVSYGRVSAAIWENQGKDGVFQTVSFERTFKDGDEYKSTSSYGLGNDLSNLERCLFDVKLWNARQRQKS